MKRNEIENLNNLLKSEIKSFTSTGISEIVTRIKTYKNVYQALNIEEEYHKIINLAYIPYLGISFYDMEKLYSVIEILDHHKVKIYSNVLLDDLNSFTSYLSELIWDLNIDIEDKRKIEKSLSEI